MEWMNCVTIINAFILFCQCKITIVNVIFSYMLVKTPSGYHFLAYAVCDPEIRLKNHPQTLNEACSQDGSDFRNAERFYKLIHFILELGFDEQR